MPIDYTRRPIPPAAGAGAPKVSLTKLAPTVSLSKQGAATGVLRVNLNWNQQAPSRGGLFRKRSGAGIDLDLGCLYEYTDGSRGVVQALGDAFEDLHSFSTDPICRLDGDDRSGSNSQGENLYIDLRHREAIERILVFAYIYEGVPNWAAADGVVTVFPATGPQIEVRLDEADSQAITCAIAMIRNEGSELSVSREVRYIRGDQADLDDAYGWGMRWAPGQK